MPRISIFIKNLLIIFAVFILSFFNANAYDDKTTHPALTDEIVDFYNLLNPQKQLTSQEKEWIVEGSILEDTPPRWINHFYDPISKEGWTGEKAGRISSKTIKKMATVGLLINDPISAVQWVNNRLIQQNYSRYQGDRTWKKALEYFADENYEQAYKTLGYVLHLLEDQSVPDHTRNDTHAHELEKGTGDYGSPYEEYLKQYNRQKIKELNIPQNIKNENAAIPQKLSIEDYLISLATYSNKYFFSKDTINDPKYQNPKIIRDDGNFGYGVDENGKEFVLALSEKSWNKEKRDYDVKYFIEKAEPAYYSILNAYFYRLSRQAVLHGAGVINLFFQQAKDEIENREYPAHLLKYDGSNLNIPSLSFVGEVFKIKQISQSTFAAITNTFNNVANSAINGVSSLFSNSSENTLSENILPNAFQKINQTQVTELPANEEKFKEETALPEINVQELATPVVQDETIKIEQNQLLALKTNSIAEQKEQKIVKEEQKIAENKKEDFSKNNSQILAYSGSGGGGGGGGSSGGGSSNSGNSSASSASKTYPKILITEIQISSTSSVHQEFVELYNPNDESVDLTDWYVQKKTGQGNNFSTFAKSDLFSGKTINAKSFLLITHSSSTLAAEQNSIITDYGISDNNIIVIKNPNGDIVDKVGWGETNDCDGSPTGGCAINPADGQSIQRKLTTSGVVNFKDTDNNAQDFEIQTCPSPKAQSANCQTNQTAPVATSTESQIATSTTATSSETTATSTLFNLVISEIQVKGDNQDDEFIELYNPNNIAISLTDYSIQYLSGLATSTENIQKKNFSNSAQISAKSFYLLVNNSATSSLKDKADATYSSFSLSGSSNGAIIFLASSSSHISGVDDPAIVDYFSYGSPGITVSAATSTAPDSNKSLERKAYSTSTVEIMISEHKFFGNGYDSNSGDDFVLTGVSNPQNSQNLPEPRNTPTTPQNFSIQYSSSTMSLNLNWSASQDYNGATSTLTYKINTTTSDVVSIVSNIETTSTAASIALNENNFGKTYIFSIQAFDKENLSSASSTASISIPNSTLIIVWQSDKSVSERGTGNGDFYQYLGSGLLGSPKNLTFRAKFQYYWGVVKPYYIKLDFWQSDNPDYSSSTIVSTSNCYFTGNYGPLNNCSGIQIESEVAKDYIIPIQQEFNFNPEKYYKMTLITYQADNVYFYGSADSASYIYGKAAKDNGGGAETDGSMVKDLYFKIETSLPIEIPANISQSIPQNFELSYSTSSLALSLNWREPRYFNETSLNLTYKIQDINYLVSSSTLVLPEINTAATSTVITLNEVARKYKFSIQGFDANGSSTIAIQSKTISIPYSLLGQFVIAKQTDYSVFETGDGNGQFYQTLGSGLSGKLGAISVKINSTGYYARADILQYGDSNYSNLENTVSDAAGCSSNQNYSGQPCANYYIDNNVLTLPAKTNFTFDPTKYYKIKFMTYQSSSAFYGSSDANSYANGQSTKDNGQGLEISTSPIKDLYFTIVSATPL